MLLYFIMLAILLFQEKERQNWEANLKSLKSKLEESENVLVQMEIESTKAKCIVFFFFFVNKLMILNYINQ
jgi:hypothetical protein